MAGAFPTYAGGVVLDALRYARAPGYALGRPLPYRDFLQGSAMTLRTQIPRHAHMPIDTSFVVRANVRQLLPAQGTICAAHSARGPDRSRPREDDLLRA